MMNTADVLYADYQAAVAAVAVSRQEYDAVLLKSVSAAVEDDFYIRYIRSLSRAHAAYEEWLTARTA